MFVEVRHLDEQALAEAGTQETCRRFLKTLHCGSRPADLLQHTSTGSHNPDKPIITIVLLISPNQQAGIYRRRRSTRWKSR